MKPSFGPGTRHQAPLRYQNMRLHTVQSLGNRFLPPSVSPVMNEWCGRYFGAPSTGLGASNGFLRTNTAENSKRRRSTRPLRVKQPVRCRLSHCFGESLCSRCWLYHAPRSSARSRVHELACTMVHARAKPSCIMCICGTRSGLLPMNAAIRQALVARHHRLTPCSSATGSRHW
jgi:hypothetical protein